MTVKITNITELLNHFKNDSGLVKTEKDIKNLKKFLQDDKFIDFFESSTVSQPDKKKKSTEDKEDESDALIEAYTSMITANPETNFKEDSTVGTSIVGSVGCMWYLKTGKNNSCCGKIEKNYYFLKNEIPLCEACSKKKTVNKLVSLLGKTGEKKNTPSSKGEKKSAPSEDEKKSTPTDKKTVEKKSTPSSSSKKSTPKAPKNEEEEVTEKKKKAPSSKKKAVPTETEEKKKKKKSLISSDDEEDDKKSSSSEDKSSIKKESKSCVKKKKDDSSSSSDSDSSSTFRIK